MLFLCLHLHLLGTKCLTLDPSVNTADHILADLREDTDEDDDIPALIPDDAAGRYSNNDDDGDDDDEDSIPVGHRKVAVTVTKKAGSGRLMKGPRPGKA